MERPQEVRFSTEGQSREVNIISSDLECGLRGVEVCVEAKMELQRLRVTGQGECGGWRQIQKRDPVTHQPSVQLHCLQPRQADKSSSGENKSLSGNCEEIQQVRLTDTRKVPRTLLLHRPSLILSPFAETETISIIIIRSGEGQCPAPELH